MMFEIKQLTTKHEKMWDEYVLKNENSTFYHQIGWKKVIEANYGYKSYYFFAENDNGEVIGILPTIYMNSLLFGKRLISLPFGSYGGACADHDLITKALVEEAINCGNHLGADYCEFRNLNSSITSEHLSCNRDYYTFHLDLSKGIDPVWSGMSATTKNRVRKGEKNLKFEIYSDLDAISDFYEIYSINLKHLGTPVHSYSFFRDIYENFPGNVFIAKAILNNNIISSMYLLKFKNILINGWSASIPSYLEYSPNNFIYWNSIKHASDNNCSCFDFGRSLSNTGNEQFKSRWGAAKVPLSYFYYPSIKMQQAPQNEYGKFARMWSKLPFSLTKKMGPKVRRHFP